ncbi:MAG: hypothetical protein ACJ8FS_01650 [Sphingomicrobium sp.]
MQESKPPKATQTISNVKVRGGIDQRSDTSSTRQKIDEATADSMQQKISGQGQTLRFGNYSASGKWAVLALLAILVAYLAFRYLGKN